MKTMRWRLFAGILILAMMVCACGKNGDNAVNEPGADAQETGAVQMPETAAETSTQTEESAESPEAVTDGSSVSSGGGAKKESSEEQEGEVMQLVFVTPDGITIAMDEPAGTLLAKLGEYGDYFEYTGCAGLGVMKYYYYTGFELGTYQDEERNDRVYSVAFTNDVIETPEGLCIGDSMERAISLYGAYGEADETIVMATIGNTTLTIQGQDQNVVSIQYLSRAASAIYQ